MSSDLRSGDAAYYEALGRAIKVLRTARGLERKELAALADISYPYLSQIEAGAKRASSDVVRAIADALGLRPHELLESADTVMTASQPSRDSVAPPAGAPEPPDEEMLRAAPPPAPAMSFMMAAPPPKPARSSPPAAATRWFHRETAPPQPPPPPPEPSGESPRRQLLGELVALTETLTDDDLERLVDLARRLAASPMP